MNQRPPLQLSPNQAYVLETPIPQGTALHVCSDLESVVVLMTTRKDRVFVVPTDTIHTPVDLVNFVEAAVERDEFYFMLPQ